MSLGKIIGVVIGVLLVVLGCVWMLQGFNILPGSFMTGHLQWAYRGIALTVIGVVLILWINRKRA